jgi:hypothetical protein
MAESVAFFIAGSFQHDTTSVLKISIAGGALQTVTIATGWYRVWLAATGGGGTAHTDPKEYLAYVKSLLDAASPGNNWTVRMGTSGLVELTYTGATYAITWDGTSGTDKKTRSVLGFTANIGTTASGTYSTASAGPCFCVAGAGRRRDSYWTSQQEVAAAQTELGTVYGWSSGRPISTRTFDVFGVPTDTGALTTLGIIATPYSPAYPDATRWTAPMTVPPSTLDYVYSWFDFIHGMGFRELGAAIKSADGVNLTGFAIVQAGTSTKFDKCYLHPESIGKFEPQEVSNSWHLRKHVPSVRLNFVAQPSIA